MEEALGADGHAAGRNLVSVAARCESIGRHCEFGFVQRKLGLEPTSLLRWAKTTRDHITAGLQFAFDGLAAGDDRAARASGT